jgi:hypothetical protein
VADDKLNWTRLRTIPQGILLSSLGLESSFLGSKLYRLAPAKYCLAELEDGGEATLISLLWASSDGAAKRVYLNDIESDDSSISMPPQELLPLSSALSYGEILEALKASDARGLMEHASYRIMSDGAFIHKAIESETTSYYFRSPELIEQEWPYAILWKLRR